MRSVPTQDSKGCWGYAWHCYMGLAAVASLHQALEHYVRWETPVDLQYNTCPWPRAVALHLHLFCTYFIFSCTSAHVICVSYSIGSLTSVVVIIWSQNVENILRCEWIWNTAHLQPLDLQTTMVIILVQCVFIGHNCIVDLFVIWMDSARNSVALTHLCFLCTGAE